jgi:peroxiredoxin
VKDDKADLEAHEWEGEEEEVGGGLGGGLRFLLVPLIVVVLIGASVWFLQASSGQGSQVGQSQTITFGGPAAGPAPKVGALAPDFTLPDLEGKPVSLSSFRGKVVILNFFATWCPPCRAEMPDLEVVYKELKGQGFEVVAIDLQEDERAVKGFASSLGLTFPILLDREASVFGQYHVTGLPTSYFIDREGVIRELTIGAMNRSIIMEKLRKIL